MDLARRGALHYNGENLYYDANDEDLLDDEENIFMFHIRASLLW